MKVILYHLRSDKNGKSFLGMDLTNCLTDFENHQTNTLEIKLPEGAVYLNKWQYVNKMKIYDSGKHFFIVANKQLDTNAAFNCLLRHAISKVSTKADFFNQLKRRYQSELKVA